MPDFTAENATPPLASELAGLRDELQRTKQELEAARQELKRFQQHAPADSAEPTTSLLSAVTHDLRTPLSAILLWTSLIEDEKLLAPEQLTQALTAIKDSAEELSALVEKLGAQARVLAGKSNAPVVRETAPGSAASSTSLGRCHVLLIEDVDGTREELAAMLQRLGATADAVDSAAAAWEAMDRHTPDVIVTDLTLPTIDAVDFVRQLRESGSDNPASVAPALALTSGEREANQAELLRQGFQGSISKPVDPQKLVTAITAALAGRNLGAAT